MALSAEQQNRLNELRGKYGAVQSAQPSDGVSDDDNWFIAGLKRLKPKPNILGRFGEGVRSGTLGIAGVGTGLAEKVIPGKQESLVSLSESLKERSRESAEKATGLAGGAGRFLPGLAASIPVGGIGAGAVGLGLSGLAKAAPSLIGSTAGRALLTGTAKAGSAYAPVKYGLVGRRALTGLGAGVTGTLPAIASLDARTPTVGEYAAGGVGGLLLEPFFAWRGAGKAALEAAKKPPAKLRQSSARTNAEFMAEEAVPTGALSPIVGGTKGRVAQVAREPITPIEGVTREKVLATAFDEVPEGMRKISIVKKEKPKYTGFFGGVLNRAKENIDTSLASLLKAEEMTGVPIGTEASLAQSRAGGLTEVAAQRIVNKATPGLKGGIDPKDIDWIVLGRGADRAVEKGMISAANGQRWKTLASEARAKYTPDQNAQIDDIVKQLDAERLESINYAKRGRALSDAQYSALISDDFYIPLYRNITDDLAGSIAVGPTSTRKLTPMNPIKAVSGNASDLDVYGPFTGDMYMKNIQSFYQMGSANSVGLYLDDLSKAAPDIVKRIKPGKKVPKDAISVFIDGERVHFQVDPYVQKALTETPGANYIPILQPVKNFVTKTATAFSLPFQLLSNPIRDFFTTDILAQSLGLRSLNFKRWWAAKDVINSWQKGKAVNKSLIDNAFGDDLPFDVDTKFLERVMGEGGFIKQGTDEFNIVDIPNHLADRIYDATTGTTGAIFQNPKDFIKWATENVGKRGKKLLRRYENLGDRIEMTPRMFAAIETGRKLLREAGVSGKVSLDDIPEWIWKEMALASRNITTDFLRKGYWIGTMNNVIAFLNAAYQGSANLVRKYGNNPTGMTALAARLAVGPSMAVQAWNYTFAPDEYKSIPDYMKERYWTIAIPGAGEGSAPYYIAIPKPFGFNALSYATEKTWDSVATGEELDFSEMGRVAVDSFSPIGITGPTPITSVIPTAFKPIAETLTNTAWYGAPITPDYPFGKAPSPKYQYFPNDPPKGVFIGLANFLDKFPNAAKMSPADIEYLFEQYTAGLGKFVGQGISTAKRITEGEKPETKELPLISTIVRRGGEPGVSVPSSARVQIEDIKLQAADESARVKLRAIEAYKTIMKADGPSRVNIFRDLKKNDPKTADKVQSMIEDDMKFGGDGLAKMYSSLGVKDGTRAMAIWRELSLIKDGQRRIERKRKLEASGVLTEEVLTQLVRLSQGLPATD